MRLTNCACCAPFGFLGDAMCSPADAPGAGTGPAPKSAGPLAREALEEFQHALGIDHERATALIVLLTETVAASEEPKARPSAARRT